MSTMSGGRFRPNMPDRGGKRESLALGYGLVGLVALGLGLVGVLQERRKMTPSAAAAQPDTRVDVVVTGDDPEITDKEERMVWGYNFLGLALFGPGVLALLMLFHIHNLLAVFIAGPLVVGAAMLVVFFTVRRWTALIRRRT